MVGMGTAYGSTSGGQLNRLKGEKSTKPQDHGSAAALTPSYSSSFSCSYSYNYNYKPPLQVHPINHDVDGTIGQIGLERTDKHPVIQPLVLALGSNEARRR